MKIAQNALCGMTAGLTAGFILGGFMLLTGVLSKAVAQFGGTSIWKGFFIHLFFSSLIGTILGLFFGQFMQSLKKALLIGILYAIAWWIFAVWIITPLRMGNSIQLSISELTNTLHIFGGHSMFGLVLGGTFFILKSQLYVANEVE